MSQFPSQGEKENPLKTAPIKDTVADSDGVVLVDGQDVGTKRVLWSTIKSALGQIFAPLTRKINNKALSSDVVLTGDDIATSATDGTTVSSSLSNLAGSKQNNLALVEYLQDVDLDEIKSVGIRIAYNSCANFPYFGENDWGILEVLSTGTGGFIQRMSIVRSPGEHPILFERIFSGVAWSGWGRIALATPPQEFDLPLADGWSGWAKYSKDQFGRVLVYGLVAKSTALISGDVIGTFPEGFRPSATCPMTITSGNASDGKSFATSGYVQPSGVFTLTNGIISSGYNVGNNIAFNFVFPAAS